MLLERANWRASGVRSPTSTKVVMKSEKYSVFEMPIERKA
jgi:hypothetical protein